MAGTSIVDFTSYSFAPSKLARPLPSYKNWRNCPCSNSSWHYRKSISTF